MTATEKKDLSIIVQLRRTSNFQAEVIRRYAKFMSEIVEMVAGEKSNAEDPLLEKIETMSWNVRLDITKLIDKTY